MATSRDDIQDGTGQRSNIVGRGFTRGFGIAPQYTGGVGTISSIAGNPIQGEIGWAPGAIFVNPLTSTNGNFIWCNIGTFASANWVAMLLNDGAGSDTFANLYVTGVLHGGTNGLTINAANTGAGSATIGGTSDTVWLGDSTPLGGASAALGQGVPSNDTTHVSAAGGSATLSAASLFTGGLGSHSYTFSDVVYMLKSKGILLP